MGCTVTILLPERFTSLCFIQRKLFESSNCELCKTPKCSPKHLILYLLFSKMFDVSGTWADLQGGEEGSFLTISHYTPPCGRDKKISDDTV